jgi:microcystin degradation protein MlrC
VDDDPEPLLRDPGKRCRVARRVRGKARREGVDHRQGELVRPPRTGPLGDAGYETQIGKVAVIERDGVEIVLIERPGKIDGPSFLEALGIDPRVKDFIVVKEGLNPLVTYKGIASRILMVESPGFDRQYLPALNYQNVPRPIYPLDPDLSWSPDSP